MENKSDIDVLGRDSIIQGLKDVLLILSENREGKVFALDGKWGYGKSYIIDVLENDLLVEQNEQTKDSRYCVFHYNCWKYDYYEEPAIAIVSAMLESVNKQLDIQVQGVVKDSLEAAKSIIGKVAGEFAEQHIGINPVIMYKNIKKQGMLRLEAMHEFDSMFAFNKTLDDMRRRIQELAEQQTVVLIVDELDRCMPQYAIKVLERLHHIFDNLSNVVVLMAIDSSQLEHSVREIYGKDVDTERYLKKFINFSITIDKGKLQKIFVEKYRYFFNRFNQSDEAEDIVMEIINLCKLDIRNLEKIIAKVDLIHRMVCDKKVHSAVCAFEMMWTIFRYKIIEAGKLDQDKTLNLNNYLDMKWICNLSNLNQYNINRCFSRETLNYLKESYSLVTYETVIRPHGEYRRVEDTVSGIIWYLFDQVCSTSKRLICKEELMIEDLVGICKNFCEKATVLW